MTRNLRAENKSLSEERQREMIQRGFCEEASGPRSDWAQREYREDYARSAGPIT